MTLVYATSAQLSEWSGLPSPANAAQLIRSASLLVRKGTITSRYQTDTAGMPTDTDTVKAFMEATCAQATLWQRTNIDPSAGAIVTTSPVNSKSIGSARIGYDTSAAASVAALNARTAATNSLCDEAFTILQQAGLLPSGVGRG